MIPYRTVGKTPFRAYATFAIIALTFLMFAWEILITSQAGQPIESLLPNYAFQTCEVGVQPIGHVVIDGIRSLFLHTTFVAMLTNMLFLWIFAPHVEEFFGHRGFVLFYLIGSFGGYILTTLLTNGNCALVVGANAGLSAVMGAFFVLHPLKQVDAHVPILNRTMTLPAVFFMLVYLALVTFSTGNGPLSGSFAPFWDEVGGFGMGFLIMFVATIFKGAPPVDPFEYLDK